MFMDIFFDLPTNFIKYSLTLPYCPATVRGHATRSGKSESRNKSSQQHKLPTGRPLLILIFFILHCLDTICDLQEKELLYCIAYLLLRFLQSSIQLHKVGTYVSNIPRFSDRYIVSILYHSMLVRSTLQNLTTSQVSPSIKHVAHKHTCICVGTESTNGG